MKVFIKPKKQYGKLNKIGIHSRPEDERDIEDVFYSADRDMFETVYFYIDDLRLVRFINEYGKDYI